MSRIGITPPSPGAGRSLVSTGLLLGGLLALTGVTSCKGPPRGPALDPELVATLGLEGDEVVHTISLGGARSEETVRPDSLEIDSGDLVEFVTVDRRVHALRFPADSLGPEMRKFLEATGQDESPPLVGQGSRFVMTFENAPPGRYPFVSRGYGEEAGGTIVVRSER